MSATISAIPSPDPTSRDWSIYLDNQSFNVTGLDGTPTTISFPEINAYIYLTTAETAVAAFAVGFVSMLFIVLFLITPAAKIRKPIFALNLLSMFLVVIREICLVYVSCGPYQGVGQIFLGADAQYPRRVWSADILSVILAVAIYATIMISLILQVRVVFSTEPRTQTILTIIGAIGVIVQTGFNMTWLVVNIRNILREPTVFPLWVYTVLRIFFTSFVGVACLIFLYKLGFTIYRRRKMDMAIGPLEIIFIMFCQCLVVPRNQLLLLQVDRN
jgi:pheromone alpha factor receptor